MPLTTDVLIQELAFDTDARKGGGRSGGRTGR